VVPIDPWILSEQQNSSAYNPKRKGNTFHFNPPFRQTGGCPVIRRAATPNCIRRLARLSESREVASDTVSGSKVFGVRLPSHAPCPRIWSGRISADRAYNHKGVCTTRRAQPSGAYPAERPAG
jgi:hypothetical protein